MSRSEVAVSAGWKKTDHSCLSVATFLEQEEGNCDFEFKVQRLDIH